MKDQVIEVLNKELVNFLVDAENNLYIDSITWIAASNESKVKECFSNVPDWFIDTLGVEKSEDIVYDLHDKGVLGFVIVLHIPSCTDFVFSNENIASWEMNYNSCHVDYLYVDSLDNILSELRLISSEWFRLDLKEWKLKQNKK